jgi:hypothetical protein
MTANKNTHGQRVNSSAGNDAESDSRLRRTAAALDPDAQAILEYLDRHGDSTLEQLRGRLRIPRAYLKTILRDLEADDCLNIERNLSTIRPTRLNSDHDGREVIFDGGIGHPDDGLSVNLAARDIYRAACNRRRRATIRILSGLRKTDDVGLIRYVPVQSIACAIVAVRKDVDPKTVDSDERSSVYVTLVQTHLPLLDQLELVVYHDRPQKVEITAEGLALGELLDIVDHVAVRTERRAGADLFRDANPDEWVDNRG